jgi:hypothetical protein
MAEFSIFALEHKQGVFMKKKQEKPKAKLSKAALWWQKNPNGIGMVIHDMRAVMR